jgi:hypothetical protein
MSFYYDDACIVGYKEENYMKRIFSIVAAAFIMTIAVGVQTAAAQEDVGRLLKQLEEDSDRFSNTVAKALDASKWDGTPEEDTATRYVRAFEDSIDRLKKAYDDRGETLELAKEVQVKSRAIDGFLKKHDVGGNTKVDWGTVKATLLRLKKTKIVKADS